MKTSRTNWFKILIGFAVCLFVRLLPFRPPNIEPLLATQMPFSKAYGWFTGFIFAFASIAGFDLITNTLGVWSLLTATTYGLLGILSFIYFRHRPANVTHFVRFAVIGTLFFDGITGLMIGPLLFHQPFTIALIGQIPFTALHVLGNIGFALTLSPLVEKYIITNHTGEVASLASVCKQKIV